MMDNLQYLNQADLKKLLFSVIADDLPENDIIVTIQKLITEHTLDVSLKNEYNQTLLFQASLNAQTHVVQFLLDNGASKNIDEKDRLYH